ncbi:hypothetical protein ACYT69_12890, partial [Streptococcus pyogenes]
ADGDVVLALGGAPINTPQEFLYRLAVLGPGPQPVTYVRDGAEAWSEVVLGPAPDDPPRETLIVTEDVVLRGATLARI